MEIHRLKNIADERICFCKTYLKHLHLQEKINRNQVNDFLDALEKWEEIKKMITDRILDCPIEDIKVKFIIYTREIAYPLLNKMTSLLKRQKEGLYEKDLVNKIDDDLENIYLACQELESNLPLEHRTKI
ncbi:hypothetical protein COY27_01150 [Candidatus Woesearchaeota archaeon CG_4_10_14_0_2_um_filter_33_13]|nr:MAG: hypothetical protein COY27_01150 [Candidatus Woesearchaeota archaeon CG_4_10_14_0_2_um_filter_33_13]